MKYKYKPFLVILILLFYACTSTSNDEIELTEPKKDISGSWAITAIARNGEDISGTIDFSQFRINFLRDGTYSLENYIPFAISENGTWSLDDPQYTFKILFQTETQGTQSIEIDYPIVGGKRQLRMDISPGCGSNVYSYVLERITE